MNYQPDIKENFSFSSLWLRKASVKQIQNATVDRARFCNWHHAKTQTVTSDFSKKMQNLVMPNMIWRLELVVNAILVEKA